MKLSHAASRLRTAIAELRHAIGVGSGALLGCMVIPKIWVCRQPRCPQEIPKYPKLSESACMEFVSSSGTRGKYDQSRRPFASLDPQLSVSSAREFRRADDSKSESLCFGFESLRLEVRPTDIKLFWRIVRRRVFEAVCSYKKARMQPNA